MLNKKVKATLFIFLILFCIAAVNADEIDDSSIDINSMNAVTVESVSNEIVSIQEDSASQVGNFSALNKTINGGTSEAAAAAAEGNDEKTVELNMSYIYNSTTDDKFKGGINITKNTTIDGKGHTIDGNHTARIFNVSAGVTLTLKNIKLINGNATYGGAIYNNGTVIADNVTFDNNTAKQRGAAIYNLGVINITNSNITNNNITNRTKNDDSGGAIYGEVNSTTIISNSLIANNNKNYVNGHYVLAGGVVIKGYGKFTNTSFINNTGRWGGAIYADKEKTAKNKTVLIIENCYFENNTALYGGAIEAQNATQLTVNNSTFVNNTAMGYGNMTPNANNGGAIDAWGSHSEANITNSTFIANSAHFGGAINLAESMYITIDNCTFKNNNASTGGAIQASSTKGSTNLTIKNSKFINNTADGKNMSFGYGGALRTTFATTIDNSTFADNVATNGGGAIYSQGNLTVFNSVFDGNDITNRTYVSKGNDHGGAAIFSTGNLTVTDSKIINNIKNYENGNYLTGAITAYGNVTVTNTYFANNSGRWGGAFSSADYNNKKLSTVIENCTFENNIAIYGGAVWSWGTVFSIANSTFTNNSAMGKGNMTPNDNNGGAICIYGNTTTGNITNCTFTENQAHYGGAISLGENNGITIKDSTFINNTASNSGGAIEISTTLKGSNNVTIDNSTFIGNKATMNGGAIYNTLELNVTNSVFENNTANNGGAIYNKGNLTANNTEFNLNGATYNGGAIYNGNGTMTLDKSNFTKNSAQIDGGAIYDLNNLQVTNLVFTENYAKYNGGAIYTVNKGINTINSTFIGNKAGYSGGAIYTINGGVEVTNTTFANNTANSGGAIYDVRGNITVTNSTFENNTAKASGGALFSGDYITINNSNFTNNNASSGGAVSGLKTVTVSNSTFKENSANNGGAIFSNNGMTVTNSTFENNKAENNGGALYLNGGNGIIDNSTLKGNNATRGGAIFYRNNQTNTGVSLTVKNSTFAENNATFGDDIYTRYSTTVINNTYTEGSYANIWANNTIVNCSVVTILPNLTNNTLNVTTPDSRFVLNATVFADGASVGGYNLEFTDIYENRYASEYLGNGTYQMTDSALADFTKRSYTAVINNVTDRTSYNVTNGTVINNKKNVTVNVTIDNDIVVSENITGNITLVGDDGKVANITDNVTVKIGDNEYTVEIVNGTSSFNIENTFASGNYTLTVVFDGTTEYNPTNGTANFTVNKPDVKITINVSDITYGEDMTADITLTDEEGNVINYTGEVTVEINGKTYTVQITNGTGKLVITDKLDAGNYNMTVYFNATIDYNSANATANFTVKKIKYDLNINISDITYGENVTADITLTENGQIANFTGEITVEINGKTYTVQITNGKGKLTITEKLNAGKYTATAILNGTTNYDSAKAEANFTVNKANPGLIVDVSDIFEGENVTINIIMNHDINGNVTVYIDGKNVTVEIRNGTGKLVLDDPSVGTHIINVEFSGNENFDASNVTANFTVMDFILTVDNLTKYFGNDGKLNITLTDLNGKPLANQVITITINGVTYNRTTGADGKILMNINLDPGVYEAAVSYGNVTKMALITILSTIDGKDIVKFYRNGTQYYATFVDENGKPLANTNVTFNINGVFYTRTTDENGTAKLTINLYPNEYIITAINPINNETFSNKVTVLSTISADNIVKYFRNGTQYYATFVDENGKPLANTNVTFNINGVFYTRTTDENGTAKLSINLNPGQYIITATNPVNNQTYSNVVTVLSTIISEDLSMTTNNRKQFKAVILDEKGNPLSNTNVTFNINGVLYTRTTDSEGVASLNINLIAGKYIITTYFNGLSRANLIEVIQS